MFTYLKKERETFLQIEYIEMDTIGQQQAVFGYQDHFVRMMEKAFSVLIGLHQSKIEIKGEDSVGVWRDFDRAFGGILIGRLEVLIR